MRRGGEMVAEGGPHWFLNSGFFKDTFDFEAHIEQCGVAVKQREKDLFIKHYHENYDEPELPPGWMMMEILPFGTLSRMCEKLEVDYRKKMAAEFNVHHKMLVQWMHAMVNLRNVCAHYGRLWNAQLGVLPKEIREHEDHFRFLQEGNGGNFYPAAVVTNLLLRAITQDTKWPGRFVTLVHTAMKNNPYITEKSLGMPPDWDQDTRLWP